MRRWLLAVVLLVPVASLANTYDDVLAMLAKPDTKPVDVVAAINASTDTWYPHEVYALIDKHAPKEVIGAVATKAAVFYDGSALSLDEQGTKARTGQTPQTIPVATPDDLVQIFEFFNDRKNDIDAAKATVGPAPVQGANDMVSAFDKKYRTWQESVVAAIGPAEGQIDTTTFPIDLAATWVTDANNCAVATLHIDLPNVPFMLFRTGMGGPLVLFDVKLDKSVTVQALQWGGEGGTRFQGNAWPICDPAAAHAAAATTVKFKGTIQRTHVGGDWTGKGEFVDAKAGTPIATKKPK